MINVEKISYHSSFWPYDSSVAPATFLPLWTLDAKLTSSPLRTLRPLRPSGPRLTLH